MADEESEKTKRRWERFKVELRVSLSVWRNGKELRFNGTANDISEGGMRLFVAADLYPGETIDFDLSLKYSGKVSLKGVIRNRDRFEYGVEYLQPTAAVKDAITRNCRALSLLGESGDS